MEENGDFGINRNIVECKFNLNADRQCCEPSINRNIVECKYTVIEIIEINATVLIETLWNVNV